MKAKQWIFRIALTMAFILLAAYPLGSIDYWRLKNGNRPIFVVTWEGYFDGGTIAGGGLGYSLYSNHGCMYSMRHGKTGQDIYWTDGPEIDFWWLPFLNQSQLKAVPLMQHLQEMKKE